MSDTPRPRNRPLRRLLIIMDVIYSGVLVFSIVPAIFSIMLAAGGNTLRVHIQIFSLMTFPFVLLFGILVPWIFYALRMGRTAKVLLFLPWVSAVIILFYIVIPEWLA